MSITVLVPAHNEEAQIADTLTSLLAQTRVPDRIVVISDNSTDRTVEVARTFPVEVMETVDNPFRKSGALNQGFNSFAQDSTYVMSMDADTVFAPDFVELAVAFMDENPEVGGACAIPTLKEQPETSAWGGVLWRLGKLDFGGYMRILCRWNYQPEVLFGYGTVLRTSAVLTLDNPSEPWVPNSIVEDYRLSIDLRRIGWKLDVIPGAVASTDVPTSMRELWVQRVRWAGGTWQELAHAGWHSYTRKVWLSALGSVASSVLRIVSVVAWVMAIVLHIQLSWSPIWLIPIAIAVWDRADMIRYTKGADWKDLVLSASVVPLELMALVREAWTLVSAWTVFRNKNLAW